jgi:lipopolysaccharide cholinephosphotransferase
MKSIKNILLPMVYIVFGLCAQEDTFYKTPEPIVQKIYQMLKDVTDVFHIFGIEYWVDSGTMLGAVRSGGLIPWDDDLDLCMLDDQDEIFLKAVPFLHLLGYSVIAMPFGYKIYSVDGDAFEKLPWTHPGCDIFITYENEDKICYKFYWQQERKYGPFYMKKNDIFPLRWHCFGPLQVYGPCNPLPYLNKWYGDDWYDVAYRYYSHGSEKALEKEMMLLTDESRKPARPQEKLKNRVTVPIIQQWPQDFVFK